MATRANITSVEAIESFRANLILYLSKAKPAIEEASAEIVRTRVWLQSNQRVHWEGVCKKRARELEEAKAALFSSKISNLREASSAEQLAVTKAKRKLEEAESKLRIIRRWDREYDNLIEPMIRKLEKMQIVLMDDLVKAVTHLTQTVNTLDAYARMGGGSALATDPILSPGTKASAESPTGTEAESEASVASDPAAEKGGAP